MIDISIFGDLISNIDGNCQHWWELMAIVINCHICFWPFKTRLGDDFICWLDGSASQIRWELVWNFHDGSTGCFLSIGHWHSWTASTCHYIIFRTIIHHLFSNRKRYSTCVHWSNMKHCSKGFLARYRHSDDVNMLPVSSSYTRMLAYCRELPQRTSDFMLISCIC